MTAPLDSSSIAVHVPPFVSLLRRTFESYASRRALRYRGENFRFDDLQALAEGVGAVLQARGIEPGDRVVLFTPEKLPFLIAHLGILLCGAVSLPLNFGFTPSEMGYFLQDSGARCVFASGAQADRIESIRETCPSVAEVIDPGRLLKQVRQPFRGGSPRFRQIVPKSDAPCLMLYSSGTTGQPKGVVHTQHNLAASLLALQKCWQCTPEDRLLNVLPLFHIHGLSFASHLSLISGSALLLEDSFHPLRTMDQIHEASVFMAVPPLYYAFLRRPEFREKAQEWSGTRLFTCGSAPIRPEVLPELEATLGQSLINRYGMTESHVITSIPLGGPYKQGSVGLPLEGIELKLVTEDGQVVSPGATATQGNLCVGEIQIRGPNLFSHYWNKPEATTEAFDGDRFFATGDLGYLDAEGFLTLVGRKKDLIITNGYNVYPPVVERVLNAFPQVRESAVVGIPDLRRGERVVAFVVPEDRLDLDALRRHCHARLVDYQRPIQFEQVDSLPRNTMGKVLKRELRVRERTRIR